MNDLTPILEGHRGGHPASAGRPHPVTLPVEAAGAVDLQYLRTDVPQALDRCIEGLHRVATIVRSMKEFAHPGNGEQREMDINQAVTTALTIARNEYKYVADVETDLGSIPAVTCYSNEINQALLNLIVNAAQAIREVVKNTDIKGRIGIKTCREGESVVVAISDTGGGIGEEIRDRIFDPFFTTKEVGAGTGQGLSIARSAIVEKHGGDLFFQTEVGKGTTFVVRLPIGGIAMPQTIAV
jgi:signal transduction histidine kinase